MSESTIAPELAVVEDAPEASDGTSYIVLRVADNDRAYEWVTNVNAGSVENAYAILAARAEKGRPR